MPDIVGGDRHGDIASAHRFAVLSGTEPHALGLSVATQLDQIGQRRTLCLCRDRHEEITLFEMGTEECGVVITIAHRHTLQIGKAAAQALCEIECQQIAPPLAVDIEPIAAQCRFVAEECRHVDIVLQPLFDRFDRLPVCFEPPGYLLQHRSSLKLNPLFIIHF